LNANPDAGTLVIDTNCVLDLLVFEDPRTLGLGSALASGAWRWLACDPMPGELRRVLDYPAVAPRLRAKGWAPSEVMDRYLALVELVPRPSTCALRCADPDDQVFIDLAVGHRARLLSKDRAVLALRKRLEPLGVSVLDDWI
jgi:predicted nucleic acid-binding protein